MEYKDEWIEEELKYILFRLRKYNRMIRLSENERSSDDLPESRIRTLHKYNIRMNNLIDEIENEFPEGDKINPTYMKRVGGMLIYPWRASLPLLRMEYAFFEPLWNDIQEEIDEFRKNSENNSSTKIRGLKVYGKRNKHKKNLKVRGVRFDDELYNSIQDFAKRSGEDKAKVIRRAAEYFLVIHDDEYYTDAYNQSAD